MIKLPIHRNKTVLIRLSATLIAAVYLSLQLVSPVAALIPEQVHIYNNFDGAYFNFKDEDVTNCGATTTTDAGSGGGNQTNNPIQAKKIFDYLTSLKDASGKPNNMSGLAATAFLGNWAQESGLDPTIGGGGLVQWGGGRLTGLNQFAASQGKPANDLFVQLDYVVKEVTTDPSYGPTLAAVRTGTDVAAVTQIISDNYERPDKAKANNANRIKQAQSYSTQFGTAPPGAGVFSSTATGGGGAAAGGGAAGGTGATPGAACGAQAVVTTGGCANPIPDPAWKKSLSRTDDGVDYHTVNALPLLAICDMTILNSSMTPGWPGANGGAGAFIYAKLTSGPFTGKCWYYAENITNLPAKGTKIPAGQLVAMAGANKSADPGIEIGFARADHLAATSVGDAGYPSQSGLAAAKFLRSLGAPTRDDPGPNAPNYGGGSCP